MNLVLLRCIGWYLAMFAVTVLALLPVQRLQMSIFNRWDKAPRAGFCGVTVGRFGFGPRYLARGARHAGLWCGH